MRNGVSFHSNHIPGTKTPDVFALLPPIRSEKIAASEVSEVCEYPVLQRRMSVEVVAYHDFAKLESKTTRELHSWDYKALHQKLPELQCLRYLGKLL